ncbi:sigma-54 interaction domain-containing protein [Oceanobacillus sp. FSL K6-0251]|uniref:sigma-54 interaction domain-containing protein n=1 Tax=Oceanobacillus sp. FSL K6-0251 TaxID=2921602 RepID=UPI0030F811CB
MKIEHFVSKVDHMGVLLLNQQKKILFQNKLAKQYTYYLGTILDSVISEDNSFCILDYPAEISTFNYNQYIVVCVNPRDDFVRLSKEKETLQELRQELNEVINSSFDGIVISDERGTIIHQNPSYEKITGLSSEELIGRSLKELEDEKVIDESSSLKALRDNKEITIIQKINTGASVLISAVPIRNKNGNIKKVVNNVRDLSELNMLETEIKNLKKKNQAIHEELELLKHQKSPEDSIIAHSEGMQEVLNRALRVAHIDSSVIVQGPSGVGKEKIVELIHKNSIRSEKPLIKVNCGAIPEALLESELFGYISGAFTGASQKGKAGLFEAANKGTILLDEIGEMNKDLQVKLLRVIQEREITRVGDTRPIPIDVRIIAATHRNLAEMVEIGTFRNDLYYLLNVIPIHIPPLKNRKKDIIPLVYHFLKDIKAKYAIERKFSEDVLQSFRNYDWPGNVRELQNLVERVAVMSTEPEVEMKDVQKELQININPTKPTISLEEVKSLKEQIENHEAAIIEDMVGKYPSIRKAATALSVDQSTLVRKMKKYGIEKH